MFKTLNYGISILTHLKLCLATATHNFKWVEIEWLGGKMIQVILGKLNILKIIY